MDHNRDELPFERQLAVWHDFHKLLNLRLLSGVTALRERGLELFISRDLKRLVCFNHDHRANWGSLFPAMDPYQAQFDDDHGLMIEGRDTAGKLVFTGAVRKIEIIGSNLKTEFESMRAYYGDPSRQRRRNEWIEITAASASLITGRIGLVGGLWVAPEWRGAGLPKIFAPVVRWYAHSLWNLDWVAAFVHEGAVNAGVARGYGYASSEPFVYMRTDAVKSDLHLLSQSKEQLEAHILAGPELPVPQRPARLSERKRRSSNATQVTLAADDAFRPKRGKS